MRSLSRNQPIKRLPLVTCGDYHNRHCPYERTENETEPHPRRALEKRIEGKRCRDENNQSSNRNQQMNVVAVRLPAGDTNHERYDEECCQIPVRVIESQ